MKCGDMKQFLQQVSARSINTQCSQSDIDYLARNGYVQTLPKAQYDQAAADVATMSQLQQAVQNETTEIWNTRADLAVKTEKTRGFSYHFVGSDQRQSDQQSMQMENDTISRDMTDISVKEAKITELIQKKSIIDRMSQMDGQYLSLTGSGTLLLNDLNVRNYRVSDMDFPDFVQETNATHVELANIAQKAAGHVSSLKLQNIYANPLDPSDASLWSVGVGLAKLQGDPAQIFNRFFYGYEYIKHLNATTENKLMAAEVMTSFRANPNQSIADNSDLQDLANSLRNLEHDVQHKGHVPEKLAAGVAATILSGKRYDGSFPMNNFEEYRKISKSYETAGILSVLNMPTDQLSARFYRFRSLFSGWGYELSEDTELSSAYLAISGFEPDDVKTKMVILLEALHNYLEYPIVAASILASIPTMEANETLDLMEKAYSMLQSYSISLERSELVSLSVRMIHGIKNEIVKQLDPTATIAHTPVQFTYAPGYGFFMYHRPIIIAHSSYYSTYSGIGGAHPAHVHGYGGGGFGG